MDTTGVSVLSSSPLRRCLLPVLIFANWMCFCACHRCFSPSNFTPFFSFSLFLFLSRTDLLCFLCCVQLSPIDVLMANGFLLDKNTVFLYLASSNKFIKKNVLSFRISVACCLISSSNVPPHKSRRILFINYVLFLRTGQDTTAVDFLGFIICCNMRGWPPVLHVTMSLSAECLIFRPVGCACMSPLLLSGVN